MSSFIKVALPIVATVAGSLIGAPWLGAVVSGVEGYENGGVKGALLGAAGSYAGAALGGYGGGLSEAGTAAGTAATDSGSVISQLGADAGTGAAAAGGGAASVADIYGAAGAYGGSAAAPSISSLGASDFAGGFGSLGTTGTASGFSDALASLGSAGGSGVGAEAGSAAIQSAGSPSYSDYGGGETGVGAPGDSLTSFPGQAGFMSGSTSDPWSSGVSAVSTPSVGGDGSFLDLLKKNPALLKGGLGLLNGAYSLANSQNPLSGVEKNAAGQIQNLQNNPNSITTMPGYAAGIQAVQRQQAAQGYTGSGNSAAALNQFGNQFYNQQIQQLMQLAGGGAAVQQSRNNVAGGISQLGAGIGQLITPQANGGQSALSAFLSQYNGGG